MVGTQSGGVAWDSAGPMAKSVEDCAGVMDILLPVRNFRSSLKRSWRGIRIALLNYDEWQWDDETCARVPEYDEQHASWYQLGFVVERYLAIFEKPGLRTLKDLVEWSKPHAALKLPPGKTLLILDNGLKSTAAA
ncbi:hypothetical protein NEMBOFW57_006721 [Staphylotrichum longicolle]|uniref:Uncharacterized protein n=1 Tax=Staphylotrichum longicolle TaxID=669026 RepID=A0AAD4ETS8_9PEZI|nr:hypothetical protein NEMBOFW57_006721 [Staphylotrichum longicolle]